MTKPDRERPCGRPRVVYHAHVRPLAILLIGLTTMATPPLARAQEGTGQDEAREAFRLGGEAATEERWADSEVWFGRAYALSGAPSALYNRAVALRALGRHVDARDAFRTLLTLDIDDTVRADAQRLLAEEERRAAATPPPGESTPEPAPVPVTSAGPDPAAVAVLVAGAFLAVGGAATLTYGAVDRGAVVGSPNGELEWSDAEARLEVADILAVTGGAALGLGVGLAAVSIALFASGPGDVEVAVHGTGLTLGGRF